MGQTDKTMSMHEEDIITIVREFPDRSIQWLLETPENVRGLLLVTAKEIAERLDFARLTPLRRSFIPDNLRKREADLLFLAPFSGQEGETKGEVIIYILIEHQSTPDPIIVFRVLFSMAQIWESQRREWEEKKVGLEEMRFRPILPVVFYTGSRKWEGRRDMKSLIDIPEALEQFAPQHETLFLNLKASDPESLVKGDHPFGWALRVMQKEDASLEELEEALSLAIEHLEAMPEQDRALWEKLMRFLVMLVYHRRAPVEHEKLVDIIETSVEDISRRQEVERMGKTIAQTLIEEGKELGIREGKELGILRAKQDALMRLLRSRFGDSVDSLIGKIEAIQDINKLDALFDRALGGETLEELEIEE